MYVYWSLYINLFALAIVPSWGMRSFRWPLRSFRNSWVLLQYFWFVTSKTYCTLGGVVVQRPAKRDKGSFVYIYIYIHICKYMCIYIHIHLFFYIYIYVKYIYIYVVNIHVMNIHLLIAMLYIQTALFAICRRLQGRQAACEWDAKWVHNSPLDSWNNK